MALVGGYLILMLWLTLNTQTGDSGFWTYFEITFWGVYILVMGYFFYFRWLKTFVSFDENGITYRQGNMSKEVHIPRESIRSLAVEGTKIRLTDDQKTHEIFMNLSFSSIEGIKKEINAYLSNPGTERE
ncbi:MAG: hypothetical protein LAT81_05095 [Oceanicaulis sp.]|nr:hypothetical protein [Oceanicaulis sp.]